MNGRFYSQQTITNAMREIQRIKMPKKYLNYKDIIEGDVILCDTTLGSRVISKVLKIGVMGWELIDLSGDDVVKGPKTDIYYRYPNRLNAIKVLFNHNRNGFDQDPVQIVENYYSEYLI